MNDKKKMMLLLSLIILLISFTLVIAVFPYKTYYGYELKISWVAIIATILALYTERLEDKTINIIIMLILVLLDKNTTHVLTGNFTLLSSVDRLYITDTDDVDIDELTVNMDVSDGVAFLVIDNTEWSEGYIGDDTVQKIVDLSENFNTYEKYGEQLHSTMYWVH